jgi:fatty-acyl-CoA synthase
VEIGKFRTFAAAVGYKAPRDIDITVKLPKTSTGKIQKYMLREKEWAGQVRRVHG